MCESNRNILLKIKTDKLINSKLECILFIKLLQNAVIKYLYFKRIDNKPLPVLRTKVQLRDKGKFNKGENKNKTATYNKTGLEKRLLSRLRKYIIADEYDECLKGIDYDRIFRIKYSSLFLAFRSGNTQKALSILESNIKRLGNTPSARSVTIADRYFMNSLMNIWEEITSTPATCSNDRDNSDGYSPCTSFIHAYYKLLIDKDITQSAITGRAQKLVKLRNDFRNEK